MGTSLPYGPYAQSCLRSAPPLDPGEHGHLYARALIAFRDALRADPDLRAEYAALKQQLAREHGGNRNAYTNAKAGFVARVVSAAGIELPARDRLPE